MHVVFAGDIGQYWPSPTTKARTESVEKDLETKFDVSDAVLVGDPLIDRLNVGLLLEVAEIEGDPVGDPLDETVGDPVGDPLDETVGDPVGDPLDETVGDLEGDPLDETVGDPVGDPLDETVIVTDPVIVNEAVGDALEDPLKEDDEVVVAEGLTVGEKELLEEAVGLIELS
jgi:hypothetical protein